MLYPEQARAFRLAARLTQQQLADKLHLSQCTVCRWETAKRILPERYARHLELVCQMEIIAHGSLSVPTSEYFPTPGFVSRETR